MDRAGRCRGPVAGLPWGVPKPLDPASRGCPQPPCDPSEPGKVEPGPASPASPRALSPASGPFYPHTGLWGRTAPRLLLGAASRPGPDKTSLSLWGCAMRSPCDLGEGRESCPGETPGPAANTLMDTAAPPAPGGPSAQIIDSPACGECEPFWPRPVPQRGERGQKRRAWPQAQSRGAPRGRGAALRGDQQ